MDVTLNVLEAPKEGSCREFNTAFDHGSSRWVACPASHGYIGGTWTGDGYAVYSTDAATWSEVRLQQNSANGNTDLVDSLDPCPPAEEVEIVNQTISTMTVARDGTDTITVSGQLRYVANGTPVQDIRSPTDPGGRC